MTLTEREFFEGAIRGLRKEEVDKDDLKEQEDAVADVVLPTCAMIYMSEEASQSGGAKDTNLRWRYQWG